MISDDNETVLCYYIEKEKCEINMRTFDRDLEVISVPRERTLQLPNYRETNING